MSALPGAPSITGNAIANCGENTNDGEDAVTGTAIGATPIRVGEILGISEGNTVTAISLSAGTGIGNLQTLFHSKSGKPSGDSLSLTGNTTGEMRVFGLDGSN